MLGYEVTTWKVTSEEFNGIVYTQAIALDCLGKYSNVLIEMVKLYRPTQPLPHMTYRKLV